MTSTPARNAAACRCCRARPGTHLNLVGSRYAGPTEVDNHLVMRSRFIADTRTACYTKALGSQSKIDGHQFLRNHETFFSVSVLF
jgi:ornithine cyclodeaminase/alanine dehydrogenase-like protein (mu-crystallin family)